MNLSKLLVLHAVITFAAGVVLVAAPGLIPSAIGISLNPDAYLLSYLLAGAEFGFSFLSFWGRTLIGTPGIRIVVWTIILFHATTALFELYAITQGVDSKLWLNVGLRALVIAAFYYFGIHITSKANIDTDD